MSDSMLYVHGARGGKTPFGFNFRRSPVLSVIRRSEENINEVTSMNFERRRKIRKT
jgi:hypothetical protein